MSPEAAVLGTAWAVFVLVAAAGAPASPRRIGGLVARPRDRGRVPLVAAASGLLTTLGRVVRRAAGRPASPAADRRVGTAVVVASAGAAIGGPLAGAAAAAVVVALPAVGRRRVRRRKRAALLDVLPDTVDLFSLAVGAGLTVPLAVQAVAERAPPPFAAEFGRAADEARLGRRLADALEDLPGRLGDEVRPLVGVLVSSERYGVALAPSLERLAGEVRRDRRRRAEEAIRRVPVKLLFPLVCCTLPAFALLTVVPLLAGSLQSLRL